MSTKMSTKLEQNLDFSPMSTNVYSSILVAKSLQTVANTNRASSSVG